MNLCKCKYAKEENGGGNSATWWFICRILGGVTDPKKCSFCPWRKEP